MSSRKWKKSFRRFVVPIWVLWSVLLMGWLIWHSRDVGGRPLTILWGADPEMFDPQRTSNAVAADVFRQVCEPLFYDGDGEIHGLLAEDDWAVSDDGLRVTIAVRSGITFHDGAELNALAVQKSFERLQRLGVSPLLNDLRQVKVEAQPDGKHVQFSLPEPDYEFVRFILNSVYAAIVSPKATDDASNGFVACTGPYRFQPNTYQPSQFLALERYKRYRWTPDMFTNRGAPRVPELHYLFVADREKRLQKLINGEGCVLSLSKEDTPVVASLSQIRLYHANGGVTYLGFNFQQPIWQDLQARQAIAMALDKKALADLGPFAVADTPLSPTAIGYDPVVANFAYFYNPTQSRLLLQQANFDTAASLTLLIPESSTYRTLAKEVQRQLGDIGLNSIKIREVPIAKLLTERQEFDLLLFDYAWMDYSALSLFLGPGPRNLLAYPHNDIAALALQARATLDLEKRQALVQQAQRNVLEQALWQPLLVRKLSFAVNSSCVTGERQSFFGELLFQDANTFSN